MWFTMYSLLWITCHFVHELFESYYSCMKQHETTINLFSFRFLMNGLIYEFSVLSESWNSMWQCFTLLIMESNFLLLMLMCDNRQGMEHALPPKSASKNWISWLFVWMIFWEKQNWKQTRESYHCRKFLPGYQDGNPHGREGRKVGNL